MKVLKVWNKSQKDGQTVILCVLAPRHRRVAYVGPVCSLFKGGIVSTVFVRRVWWHLQQPVNTAATSGLLWNHRRYTLVSLRHKRCVWLSEKWRQSFDPRVVESVDPQTTSITVKVLRTCEWPSNTAPNCEIPWDTGVGVFQRRGDLVSTHGSGRASTRKLLLSLLKY